MVRFSSWKTTWILLVSNSHLSVLTQTVTLVAEPVTVTLANATDNTATLEDYDGKKVDSVTLSDRTLFKDGSWNTLCLPFDVDLNDASYADAATELCLYGAEVRRLGAKPTAPGLYIVGGKKEW